MDEITVDEHKAGTALRPVRCGDSGDAAFPVVVRQDGAGDVERVQEGDDVRADSRLPRPCY